MTRKTELYGFEGYDIYNIDGCVLNKETASHMEEYYWYRAAYPDWDYMAFGSCNIIHSHKELTQTAKSIYVHPACRIPRNLLRTQYKIKNNPWEAEIVAVPEVQSDYEYYSIVLINEEANKIFVFYKPFDLEFDFEGKENMTIEEMMPGITPELVSAYSSGGYYGRNIEGRPFRIEEVLSAVLLYAGDMSFFLQKSKAMYEVMTGQLPESKTVLEEDVFENLDDKDRELTKDTALNLQAMLESNDEEIVTTGLKTLAMLNYAKYPNSAKYLLASAYKYNKAFSHSAVKFMVELLNFHKHHFNSNFYDMYISKEDAEIFMELRNCRKDSFDTSMHYFNFMYLDADGIVKCRISK